MIFQKQEKYISYNHRIYDLIPLKKNILEVGCATGELLKKLREKKCYTVGLEKDKNTALEAKGKCHRIIVGDIETIDKLPFSDKFFNVIVFGDVLEHLQRPDKVLEKLKKYLCDDGYVLLSIPNIAFISVRIGLLFGRFSYTEYGPLDRSHLRFFTLTTAKRLMEESGYKITHLEGYNQVRARYFLLKPLGKLWKTLFATDFIIKAIKKKE